MATENIKLSFASSKALQTFAAGLYATFLLSFDEIDYVSFYNMKRFYAAASNKIDSLRFQSPKKKITMQVELNVYNTIRLLFLQNSNYLKHPENAYLQIIVLEILEQGEKIMQQKKSLYDAQNIPF